MHSFDKILIGIAFSPNIIANVHEAVRLANMFGSELVCVHVGDKTDLKEQKINDIFDNAPALNLKKTLLFEKGEPVKVLLNACEEYKIDLLILGALKKENIYNYYVGSIARILTRKATCSVLLLIKHSIKRISCKHIVVNGLKDPKTEETIQTSFYVSQSLSCPKITIVEEITQQEIHSKASNDVSLRKMNIEKERITNREEMRVKDILRHIPKKNKDNITIKTQSIFGKRGYSIGHYARVVRADLLIMNAPNKATVWDRLFPHDMEYILSELPTDVLIVK